MRYTHKTNSIKFPSNVNNKDKQAENRHLLIDNLVHFSSDQVKILVDLFLVSLVDLGQREQPDDTCKSNCKFLQSWTHLKTQFYRQLTQNYERQAVEPRAHVGQAPEDTGKLDRVDKVLDEEQPAKLEQSGVQTGGRQVSHFVHFLGRDGNIGLQILPKVVAFVTTSFLSYTQLRAMLLLEWMAVLSLLNGLEHILVESEGEGDGQNSESRVRDDGNDWDHRKWQEDSQNGTEHDATLAGIPPVHQVRNCNSTKIHSIINRLNSQHMEDQKLDRGRGGDFLKEKVSSSGHFLLTQR